MQITLPKRRHAGLGLVLIVGCWAGALGQPAFESLPEAKALAMAPQGGPAARGLSHSEPHDLIAALRALEQCQTAAAPGQTCEIVQLNDQRITTGEEILAQVPDGGHPLFLWRYQQAGNVVYLAGSIHILKPSLYPLPTQLETAFQRSDYLVLEVDVGAIAEPEMQRRTLVHALLPTGQSLRDVVPAGLYQRLDRHLSAYGMTTDMVDQAKPAMVMNQIVVSRLMTLGYLPDSGLENHFLGQRTRQQVLELESLDDQLGLLFDQPLATQVQLLEETLDLEPRIEPLLAGMLVAWLSGDDVRLLEMFRAQSGDSPLSRAFIKTLLDDRNLGMAAGIRNYLEGSSGAEPGTYFVLVGAAHLVGERGIVSLLEGGGIVGQRILSTDRI